MKTDHSPTCPHCGAEEILPGECPGGCDIIPLLARARDADAAKHWGDLLGSLPPLSRVRFADCLRELVKGGVL